MSSFPIELVHRHEEGGFSVRVLEAVLLPQVIVGRLGLVFVAHTAGKLLVGVHHHVPKSHHPPAVAAVAVAIDAAVTVIYLQDCCTPRYLGNKVWLGYSRTNQSIRAPCHLQGLPTSILFQYLLYYFFPIL